MSFRRITTSTSQITLNSCSVKFETLVNLIPKTDAETVRRYLAEDKQGNFCKKTAPGGGNLAFYAAQTTDIKVFEVIYDYLKKHNQLNQFCYVAPHNTNLLHVACNRSKPAIINRLIEILGDRANSMACSVSDNNYLPLILIDGNPNCTDIEKMEMQTLIKLAMFKQQQKPLSEPLSLTALLTPYPNLDEETKTKFILACLVCNLARMLIPKSSTHLDANKLSDPDWETMNDSINLMRHKAGEEELKIQCEIKDENAKVLPILHVNFKKILEYGVGNCGELAYMVALFHYLLMPESKIVINEFEKGKGDHTYNVIQDLVLDAWSDNGVYLVKDILTRLKYYNTVDSTNMTGPLNPKVHKPNCRYKLHNADRKESKIPPIDILTLVWQKQRFDLIQDLLNLPLTHVTAFQRVIANFVYSEENKTFFQEIISLLKEQITAACQNKDTLGIKNAFLWYARNPVIAQGMVQYIDELFLIAAENQNDVELLEFLLKNNLVNSKTLQQAFLKTTQTDVLKILWEHCSNILSLEGQCDILAKKYPDKKIFLDMYLKLSALKKKNSAAELKYSLFAPLTLSLPLSCQRTLASSQDQSQRDTSSRLHDIEVRNSYLKNRLKEILNKLPNSPFKIDPTFGAVFPSCEILSIQSQIDQCFNPIEQSVQEEVLKTEWLGF